MKILYCSDDHCIKCHMAHQMLKTLNELNIKVKISNDKAPWFEHPILYIGEKRLSGEDVIDKLAEIGGERIKDITGGEKQ